MSSLHHFKTSALPAYLGLCLLLGGASAAGYIGNALLQIMAVVILTVVCWAPRQIEQSANAPLDARLLYGAFAVAISWVLVSWIPLPPTIWHALPGRGSIEDGDALLAMTDNWRSISVQPSQSLLSIFALLPPLAVIAMTLRASERSRELALWSIIGLAALSSLIGLIQLSQGIGGAAYFYEITNYNSSVGFFANSNHLATLYLIALILSAELPFGRQLSKRGNDGAWKILRGITFLFFIVNLILNTSVAGYGLAIAATIYWLLRVKKVRGVLKLTPRRLAAIAAATTVAVGGAFWLLVSQLPQLALDPLQGEERVEYARNTWNLVVDAFPVGYGLGTFRWSFAGVEPIDQVTTVYVNHAHNDFLELLSDFSIVGLAVLIMFAVWFTKRVRWLATTRVDYPNYCRAAAMSIIVVAAHSIVDYPLRTAALAAIASFLAACLARPVVPTEERHRRARRSRG